MKYALPILLSLFSYIPLSAQTVCTQTLRQARTVYDEGRIHELPSLLESCIKNGFTNEEKTEAYRLLILSYIYLDEPEKADETMLALLRHNPEFKINRNADPAELINLYGTFRTDPIFLWGIRGGANYTFVNVLETYSVYDQNTTSGEYTPGLGFGGALIIEKGLTDKLTGRVEANFSVSNFTHTATYLSDGNNETGIATPELIETNSWAGLSVLGQYKLIKDHSDEVDTDWNPYITIGPSINYLVSSSLSAETSLDGGEQATGTSLDLKAKEMRRGFNYMLTAGVGVKKKVGSLYFLASASYSYGFLNITESHFDNELTFKYGAALNDISISMANISIGILFQKFSPKKLTD